MNASEKAKKKHLFFIFKLGIYSWLFIFQNQGNLS